MEYKNRYKLLIFFSLVIILLIIVPIYRSKTQSNLQTAIINDKPIKVTVADTPQLRDQGYSNHPPISYNEGMLFVFPYLGNYTFWMKDMLFDLDFVYIRNNKVVYTIEQVPAPINNNGQVVYLTSPEQFNKLLEVKAGFVKKTGLKVGDQIQ